VPPSPRTTGANLDRVSASGGVQSPVDDNNAVNDYTGTIADGAGWAELHPWSVMPPPPAVWFIICAA